MLGNIIGMLEDSNQSYIIEKIIKRLEAEKINDCICTDYDRFYDRGLDKAITILKEEYELARPFNPEHSDFGFKRVKDKIRIGFIHTKEIRYIKDIKLSNKCFFLDQIKNQNIWTLTTCMYIEGEPIRVEDKLYIKSHEHGLNLLKKFGVIE